MGGPRTRRTRAGAARAGQNRRGSSWRRPSRRGEGGKNRSARASAAGGGRTSRTGRVGRAEEAVREESERIEQMLREEAERPSETNGPSRQGESARVGAACAERIGLPASTPRPPGTAGRSWDCRPPPRSGSSGRTRYLATQHPPTGAETPRPSRSRRPPTRRRWRSWPGGSRPRDTGVAVRPPREKKKKVARTGPRGGAGRDAGDDPRRGSDETSSRIARPNFLR